MIDIDITLAEYFLARAFGRGIAAVGNWNASNDQWKNGGMGDAAKTGFVGALGEIAVAKYLGFRADLRVLSHAKMRQRKRLPDIDGRIEVKCVAGHNTHAMVRIDHVLDILDIVPNAMLVGAQKLENRKVRLWGYQPLRTVLDCNIIEAAANPLKRDVFTVPLHKMLDIQGLK